MKGCYGRVVHLELCIVAVSIALLHDARHLGCVLGDGGKVVVHAAIAQLLHQILELVACTKHHH